MRDWQSLCKQAYYVKVNGNYGDLAEFWREKNINKCVGSSRLRKWMKERGLE